MLHCLLFLCIILWDCPTSTSTLLAPEPDENSLISYKPYFSKKLFNYTIHKDRDVMFSCNVKQLGSFNVGWVKADSKAIQAIGQHVITHNPRVSVSGDFNTTFNLHIASVTQEDVGQYMCQINTNPMIYQSSWLTVQVPPDFDVIGTTGDLTTREHEDTARFTCRAHGIPAPSIQWKREGGMRIRARMGTNNRMVDQVDGENLIIHRVRREDMGAYLCIANNEVPPAVSKRIYLYVQFPPSIIDGSTLLGSSTGKDVTLKCIVESYPTAFIVWTHHDRVLHNDGHTYLIEETPISMYTIVSRLTIKNYQDKHSGSYKCKGENSLGKIDSSFRVYTTEVPLPKYEIIKTPREREEKPEKQVKEQILERVKTTVKQEVQNTIEIVEQLNKEWTEKKTNVAPTGILGFNSAASQIQTSYLVVLFVFISFYF